VKQIGEVGYLMIASLQFPGECDSERIIMKSASI